jgi:hypothetical protein
MLFRLEWRVLFDSCMFPNLLEWWHVHGAWSV